MVTRFLKSKYAADVAIKNGFTVTNGTRADIGLISSATIRTF